MLTFKDAFLKASGKVRGRDALGYMELEDAPADAMQCSSCPLWMIDRRRCYWLPDDFDVPGKASCIEYVPGEPMRGDGPTTGILTPEQVGFVRGKVRCQNCASIGDDGTCGFYKVLNAIHPKIFDLDEQVSPRACCNGFMPRRSSGP